MHKAIVTLALIVGVAIFAASRGDAAYGTSLSTILPAAACEQGPSGHLYDFVRISKWVADSPISEDLRDELGVAQWPADSVALVNDPALCAKLDTLVVAWLGGPGADSLTGVSGTIGDVTVARIGPTVFHVQPGLAVPAQSPPHYPYFVVDTAAPVRVALWRATQ